MKSALKVKKLIYFDLQKHFMRKSISKINIQNVVDIRWSKTVFEVWFNMDRQHRFSSSLQGNSHHIYHGNDVHWLQAIHWRSDWLYGRWSWWKNNGYILLDPLNLFYTYKVIYCLDCKYVVEKYVIRYVVR